MTQPFLIAASTWLPVKDGNPVAFQLFRRHYSYNRSRDQMRLFALSRTQKTSEQLFVGPGEKMVLLSAGADALFVWRKFIPDDGQVGINCSVFRNESSRRASDMIREAMTLAWGRWPGERLYTYVNPKRIRSLNPGYCFLMAGWRKCGITKCRKLVILEMKPEWI